MLSNNLLKKETSSFRDPSGFLYYKNNILYRQINNKYKEDYDFLISSNLYQKLVDSNLLIKHVEVENIYAFNNCSYKVIKPEFIEIISYPYEWCFSQLKDAALLTLDIQLQALEYGMSLKDASAYNIQFKKGKPIFIDTLSFEKYKKNLPWVAYKQFCQHFLCPLLLMSKQDISLNQLLKLYIDGIPLSLTSKLLPKLSYLNFSIFMHIHLHSKTQKIFSDKNIKKKEYKMTLFALKRILDSLQNLISKLNINKEKTEWDNYYKNHNYTEESFNEKKEIILEFIDQTKPKIVCDMGANTGEFSKLVCLKGIKTIAFDIDPNCVEYNYIQNTKKENLDILALILDITNPSPGIGWDNQERLSFSKRFSADMIIALALVHHLAISNNLPLDKIVDFFAKKTKYLIIEFVPKHDSKVQKLLLTREDIFLDYTEDNFKKIFSEKFVIIKEKKINQSCRTLYLMEKK